LSQKISSLGWRPEPGKFRQKGKNTPVSDAPHREPQTQNENFFSISSIRLAESVEGLNSSLPQSAGELWS